MPIRRLPTSPTVLEATETTAQILELRRHQVAQLGAPVRVMPRRRWTASLPFGRLAWR